MTAAQKANQLRFKKVQAEAKKLKAKNKKLSHVEAVKQAWAIVLKTGKSKKVAGYVKTEKKGTTTKVVYTKKAKKKAQPKQATLFGYKKIAGTKTHKDTKSHNVNIRVVSGIGSYESAERILYEIEYWQKQLDKLRNEYKSEKGKLYKHSITQDIRLSKKWLELNKSKLKKLLLKIK